MWGCAHEQQVVPQRTTTHKPLEHLMWYSCHAHVYKQALSPSHAQVYDRDADTWTDVPTNVNSVCGGWARLANGQVGMFAGHYATLDVYQVCGAAAAGALKEAPEHIDAWR